MIKFDVCLSINFNDGSNRLIEKTDVEIENDFLKASHKLDLGDKSVFSIDEYFYLPEVKSFSVSETIGGKDK